MSKRTCIVAECTTPAHALGWCQRHYRKLHRFPAKPCITEGCDRYTSRQSARGLCVLHYTQTLRVEQGRPPKVRLGSLDVVDVLFLLSEQPPDTSCIYWTASLTNQGYPNRLRPRDQPPITPQRASWSLVNGPIPDGMHLDHVCHTQDETCPGGDNHCMHRRCINPDHLECVSGPENYRRRDEQRAAHQAFVLGLIAEWRAAQR